MLFLTVVVVLSGRVLLNIFGLILLGVIRLSYYFDGYRFDLKNETQLLTILIRLVLSLLQALSSPTYPS